jgi:hypothetical protein
VVGKGGPSGSAPWTFGEMKVGERRVVSEKVIINMVYEWSTSDEEGWNDHAKSGVGSR